METNTNVQGVIRVSLTLITKIRHVLEKENIPYEMGRKNNQENDLYFLIQGKGYCVTLWKNTLENAEKNIVVKWKQQLVNPSEERIETEHFKNEQDPNLMKWLTSWVKTKKLEGVFATNEKYLFTQSLRNQEGKNGARLENEIINGWKRELNLEADDELELFMAHRAVKYKGKNIQNNETVLIHHGRGIEVRTTIKDGLIDCFAQYKSY